MAKVCVLSENKDFTDFCFASLISSSIISKISKLEEIETCFYGFPLILIVDDEHTRLSVEKAQYLCKKGVCVLIIAKAPQIDTVIGLIKNGVCDVLEFPCSPIKLFKAVDTIQKNIHKRKCNQIFEGMELDILESSEKTKIILERFALTDLPILLLGDTGTGKSYCARKITSLSKRKDENFVEVNCSAIPESLAEIEFFGSCKGAFTGAENTIGYLEKAHKGTLFLDEVGELPRGIQAKLLKVLDDGVFYQLGSAVPKTVDIRYLFATNRDLKKSILEGKIRNDFFNRINSVQFCLPTLKNQKCKINHYINLFIDDLGKTIDEELRDVLNGYDWPGNIRELKNFLTKLSHFSSDHEIRLKDVQACISFQEQTYSNLEYFI